MTKTNRQYYSNAGSTIAVTEIYLHNLIFPTQLQIFVKYLKTGSAVYSQSYLDQCYLKSTRSVALSFTICEALLSYHHMCQRVLKYLLL